MRLNQCIEGEKAMAKKRKAVKKARKTAKPRASAAAGRQSSQDEGFLAAFMRLFGEPDSAKKRKL
jgi:hypothetical protein